MFIVSFPPFGGLISLFLYLFARGWGEFIARNSSPQQTGLVHILNSLGYSNAQRIVCNVQELMHLEKSERLRIAATQVRGGAPFTFFLVLSIFCVVQVHPCMHAAVALLSAL